MLTDLLATWKSVVTRPRRFFSDMDVSGGYGEPALFLALVVCVNSLVGLAYLVIRVGFGSAVIVQLVLSLVIVGVAVFLLALAVQSLASGMGGAGELEGTFRAIAYSSAPNLLYWIPVAGLLPLTYGFVVQTMALSAVHRVPGAKAAVLALPVHAFFAAVNVGLWLVLRSTPT